MKTLNRCLVGIILVSSFCLSNCKRGNKLDPKSAKSLIRDTISINSLTPLVLDAAMYYSKDMFTEAANSYEKLIKFDSLNGEYYYRLGYCHAQLTKDSQAVKNYAKAADLGHRRFEAYRSIGLIFSVGLNDDAKAIEYFNKCLEIDPNADEIKKLVKTIKNKSKKVNI